MMQSAAENSRESIFLTAVESIAASLPNLAPGRRPVLYGPNGQPLPPSKLANYQYQRDAAKRTGTMKKWIPKRLMSAQQAALERERIVERSIDLTNNHPHAAGMVDTFATTVVGAGLNPNPLIDRKRLDLEKDEARRIQNRQKIIYYKWAPFADAGERMSFGALTYLAMRSMVQFGEYLFLLPMLKDPVRPYSLALQAIHPLRLKTPVDKIGKHSIRDGVELGSYGQPVAYWIKKTPLELQPTPNISNNFMRIRARHGHRKRVLHGFITTDPEQVRGMPLCAAAIKFFLDLSDYLNAELVSNIVTAAFSLFVETGAGNPFDIADNLGTITDTGYKSDGSTYDQRWQEMTPGQIWYGRSGEKPHPLAANRPGTTFEPFVEVIENAIAISANVPHPVLFKKFKGLNFAAYRSAMLEAWRMFITRRTWLGQGLCQPSWCMLQEEAYLRGDLQVRDFYSNMWELTAAEWIGPPKGQIEPVKEVQADILEINNKLKSRQAAALERNRDYLTTFDQLEEEQEELEERNLGTDDMDPPASLP